ncbi:hypothetical protein [Amycolatopsis tucumanensis]|uniref:hypothetical protein n=1 Tax=Amycolatopsis tucumanensis TaxID=401106 RepID=UPI001F3C15BF|nr:hypothetical protein [Amycolatopsis tucumanensis]MCF6425361.1 hypothetical protein [Amycolatopsis tucumanensis]
MLPFTREFAALSPSEFVERTLVERLRAEAVMVGADFTFGHRAAGLVDALRELGEQRGFTTHGVGCYRPRRHPVLLDPRLCLSEARRRARGGASTRPSAPRRAGVPAGRARAGPSSSSRPVATGGASTAWGRSRCG